MRFMKNLFIGIGVAALAGVLLTFIAPKAVHAAVATLVEVTNTPLNPVPTADVHKSASQLVELDCSDLGGPTNPCVLNPPTGIIQTAHAVPSGLNLVVTDIEISHSGGAGFVTLTWNPGGASNSQEESFFVPSGAAIGLTTEFQFLSGIVILPGSTNLSAGFGGFTNTAQSVVIRGYYTPN